MNADLVGSAGFQLATDVGVATKPLNNLPMGHRRLAVALIDAHFLPVCGVPSDGGIHCAAVFF